MEDQRIEFLRYKMEAYYGQPIDTCDKRMKYVLSVPFPLDDEQIKALLMIIKEMKRSHRSVRDEYEVVVPVDPIL